MNILSLFDGMSCGQIALNRAGISFGNYYASEVDKHAIKVTQANNPETIQLGDVTHWREWSIDWGSIGLVMGGSPCQGFSFSGKGLAFDDPRSKLFFVFVEILNHIRLVNPNVKFLLENVRMKKEYLKIISDHIGVEPVLINSALVSAQNRQRYYWTNWNFTQPCDQKLVLTDVIEEVGSSEFKELSLNDKRIAGISVTKRGLRPYQNDKRKSGLSELATLAFPTSNSNTITATHTPKVLIDRKKSHVIDASYYKGGDLNQYFNKSRRQVVFNTTVKVGEASDIKGHGYNKRVYHPNGKSPSLCAASGGNLEPKVALPTPVKLMYRKLTPVECERLQTVPDNYTNHVSNTQRYRMLGNGWTVDVIMHILLSRGKNDLFESEWSHG